MKRKIQPEVVNYKRQASSLTAGIGCYRMYLERIYMDTEQLKRIADAIEEILQLVKADQERSRKYMEEKKDEVYIETLNGPELRDDGTNYK